MKDPLATYLHDHLAGADMAIDLLRAMKDRQKDEPLGQFAGYLLAEVKEDRDTLQHLADKVGAGSNVLKEFTAWLSEKAIRVKLGETRRVSSERSRLLSGLEFKQLIARAEAQYAKVEERRLTAATTALQPAKLSSAVQSF